MNNYYISRDRYDVDPNFIDERLVRLGDGLDMSEPAKPLRTASPLLRPGMLMGAREVEAYSLSGSFKFQQDTSVKEEAATLSAYFKGAYGFVSGEAAYEQAVEERGSSESIYALLQYTGYTEDLISDLHGERPAWDPEIKPAGEGEGVDPATFRRHFLLDFGSHYVSSISYGYRIGIRGKIKTTDKKAAAELKAAFQVAFGPGSAEGGMDAKTKAALSSSSLEIIAAVTAGAVYRNGKEDDNAIIAHSLDHILQLLGDMRKGEVTMRGAPISLIARTYWHLLPQDYTDSLALLANTDTPKPPEDFYGVPKGTVIAWSPGPDAIYKDNKGAEHLIPPEGWALCNGESGTPDLQDRFVRGTGDLAALGKPGGNAKVSHSHAASTGATKSTDRPANGAFSRFDIATSNHTHSVSVTASDVDIDPPHVKLAYIMKV